MLSRGTCWAPFASEHFMLEAQIPGRARGGPALSEGEHWGGSSGRAGRRRSMGRSASGHPWRTPWSSFTWAPLGTWDGVRVGLHEASSGLGLNASPAAAAAERPSVRPGEREGRVARVPILMLTEPILAYRDPKIAKYTATMCTLY